MILKVITLVLVFVAAAHQGHCHEHAYSSQHIMMHHGKHVPVYIKHHDKHGKKHHHDFYADPKYKYEYKVKDHHTGDEKAHHETRHGDVVKGSYSLHESDGRLRVVDYIADKHTGFHANVRHEGHAKHVVKKHKKHHKAPKHDHDHHYNHEHDHIKHYNHDHIKNYDHVKNYDQIKNYDQVENYDHVNNYDQGIHYDHIPHYDQYHHYDNFNKYKSFNYPDFF